MDEALLGETSNFKEVNNILLIKNPLISGLIPEITLNYIRFCFGNCIF